MPEEIEIHINGEPRLVSQHTTVSGLLAELGLAEDKVAIELDRALLKRPQWGEARLAEGSRLEIVHFVGGG